jgi:hypothetical protein
MKPSYVVIGSGSLVEAWSTARLQFEPRDWQRQFRAELRGAASVLVANGQPPLADYRSPVLDSGDAENILFYNVGTSVFVAATAAGLRFERGYVVPPCPVGLASAAQHYHRYELAPSSGAFSLWRNEARLASFGPVRLPPLSAATKPSGIWLALREAQAHIDGDAAQVPTTFALRLGLRLPSASAAPTLAAVKAAGAGTGGWRRTCPLVWAGAPSHNETTPRPHGRSVRRPRRRLRTAWLSERRVGAGVLPFRAGKRRFVD